MSLFPNILDPACYSHTMQQAPPSPPPKHRRLSLHIPHLARRSSHDSSPRRQSVPQNQQQVDNTTPVRRQSSKSEPNTPQHQTQEATEPHHTLRVKLTPPSHIHLPDFSVIITAMFAPAAFQYSPPSPSHIYCDTTAPQPSSPCVKAGTITRVDSIHVEEGGPNEEEGAPLCREAEIEKWKTCSSGSSRVPEQRWVLY